MIRRTFATLASTLGLLLVVAAGCGDEIDDEASDDTDPREYDRLVVAPASSSGSTSDGDGEAGERDDPRALGLKNDETERADVEDRRAVLAILEGDVAGASNRPYGTELVRTIEGNFYQDIDHQKGSAQNWVTRAKVVDDEGNVLWKTRVNSFFQVLELLKLTLDQTPVQLEFSIDEVFSFAENRYPNLLDFGVFVPLGIEGGEEYVLEFPDEEGEYYEVGRYDIDELVEQAERPPRLGEPATISQSGPPSDRTDVVILGDGYTWDQKEEFLGDAEAVVERFEETTPLKEHQEYFNFHRVWTASQESGAGYDCTGGFDPLCKNDLRQTTYRYTFIVSALSDRLGLDLPASSARLALPLDVADMYLAAARVPFDEIILLSNTDRRSGFAGMYAGVLTAFDDRQNFPDVAVHEFGHSFGVLGDTYVIDGDPCLDASPRIPLPVNVENETDYDALKWNRWVGPDTPLPTNRDQADNYAVGAFEGSYNCTDLYRPSFECMMRSSGDPFCPVCREQMVRRLYSDVDLLRRAFPRVTRIDDDRVKFELGLRDGGDLALVEWTLGGEPLDHDGGELVLERSQVPRDWTRLEANVSEYSTFVRKDDPRLDRTLAWKVRQRAW